MIEKIKDGSMVNMNLDRVYDDSSKLLKQMEVEAMNFMKNDEIRSRVSLIPLIFKLALKTQVNF